MSWKTSLRSDIDSAVKKSANYEEFLSNMQAMGYEYRDRKYLAFKVPERTNFTCCKSKVLGWYYVKEQIVKRIERYNALKNGALKNRRTGIVNTAENKFQNSKGLERWAIIHNMQEASKIINLLTEKGVSSVEELEEKLMNLHGERLELADRLNDLQDKINSRSELIKLFETYREYKPLYAQYKEVRAKEKFRKEHIKEITKYESALRKLKELYPDGKIPKLKSEQQKFYSMIDERNQKNKDYKLLKNELTELETARKSIGEYLDKQRRNNEISH